MQPKAWFGIIFLSWINISSILISLYPTYDIHQNTILAKLFVLAILPTLIIAFTAIYTLLSYGIVGIVAFAALFALIYFCMPIKEKKYGRLFSASLIISLLLAFGITFNLLLKALGSML